MSARSGPAVSRANAAALRVYLTPATFLDNQLIHNSGRKAVPRLDLHRDWMNRPHRYRGNTIHKSCYREPGFETSAIKARRSFNSEAYA